MARFLGARPWPMLQPVPLAPPTIQTAVPLVAVCSPGASTPRAFQKAPLLEYVRESGVFTAAYILDLPHVWLYGLGSDDQPAPLPFGATAAVGPDSEVDADSVDIPTIEEALDLFEQGIRAVIGQHRGCRVVVNAYSMSALMTLQVWPRIKRFAVECGCPEPRLILVGCALDVGISKKEMIAAYFTPQGIRDGGRYDTLRRLHGPYFHVILRCVRRWCSGEPVGATTCLFTPGQPYALERVVGDHLHVVMGLDDFVYEVPELFHPFTPPSPVMDLSHATDGVTVWPLMQEACARLLVDGNDRQLPQPMLVMVPGDHFAMLTAEGALATRAAFHLFAARIAGVVGLPVPYRTASQPLPKM